MLGTYVEKLGEVGGCGACSYDDEVCGCAGGEDRGDEGGFDVHACDVVFD